VGSNPHPLKPKKKMKSQSNSINHNGCSVCAAGEENYTTFSPAHRPGKLFYQYDYRHKDGELFSTVAPTLEQCRTIRDKWVQEKNYKRLFPNTLKLIQENKRLTKSDMAYQISNVEPYHIVSISYDFFKREEVVSTFNQIFGISIE
jgi:hypothetical protein